ncbi:MAG: hypothetical protein HYY16_12285 [Planctomycetes bacterium]|nr:hypothetical protein [Planctomycetota bacterium]
MKHARSTRRHGPSLLLLLSLVGCSSGPAPNEVFATKEDLGKLELKFTNTNEASVLFSREFTDRLGRIEQRLAALEAVTKSHDIEIRRLNERLSQLPAAGPAPTPLSAGTEEALKTTDDQIQRLRDGFPPDEVARILAPIARYAAPKACAALKDALRDVEYMKRLEAVLSKFPPADLKIPLEEALRDPIARNPAARVVGTVGDRELSRILEPYTSDAEMDFCIQVGESLIRCRNQAGVPALLRALRADDKNTRLLAVAALRSVSKNETFGYDFSKPADANAAAIKAWEEWYEKNGATLFD